MPGRIATIQTQARELGRLRMGYSEPTGNGRARPVRSDTWIVTSHSDLVVAAAAQVWGGELEPWEPQGGGPRQFRVVTDATSIEAVLPPGDPLSVAYEMWNAGGAVRRCDGVTDRISGNGCLCLKQFGEQFYEQPKGKVCDATSRLNLFLPDMPDVGQFRVETHSYYAAQEFTSAVDIIRAATGENHPVPVSLRIEHRQRKAGGETKKFPVPVVELRGITTGHILTGRVQGAALESSAQRGQLEAAPPVNPDQRQLGVGSGPVVHDADNLKAAIAQASSRDDLTAIYESIPREAFTQEVKDAFQARAAALDAAAKPTGPSRPAATRPTAAKPAAPGATRGGAVDALWQQVLATGAPKGWSTSQVEADFTAVTGVDAGHATAAHMQTYLDAQTAPQAGEGAAGGDEPVDPEDYLGDRSDQADDAEYDDEDQR